MTFLCLRRGVSLARANANLFSDFSLPTQRCFLFENLPVDEDTLFSAYAEVFPFIFFPLY